MGLIARDPGHTRIVSDYAVGFARPDRWSRAHPSVEVHPWHAVEAHRPAAELDGEVELATCGAIVQVEGSQDWSRIGTGGAVCPDCRRITGLRRTVSDARAAAR